MWFSTRAPLTSSLSPWQRSTIAVYPHPVKTRRNGRTVSVCRLEDLHGCTMMRTGGVLHFAHFFVCVRLLVSLRFLGLTNLFTLQLLRCL